MRGIPIRNGAGEFLFDIVVVKPDNTGSMVMQRYTMCLPPKTTFGTLRRVRDRLDETCMKSNTGIRVYLAIQVA